MSSARQNSGCLFNIFTVLLLLFVLPCEAIDLKELNKITTQFVKQLQTSNQVIHDEATQIYIQNLNHHLTNKILEKYQTIYCFVLNDPSINAFAGPGGYIGIHTGLILAAHNEHELASVVAHEIGHIKQGHLIRQLERMNAENLSLTLTSLAAIALGLHYPELGQAAIVSSAAGLKQLALNYSREQEAEADRIGLKLLKQSAYDAKGMVDFFKRLIKKERLSNTALIPEILKSHPLTEHRIADVEHRLLTHSKKLTPSLEFELFKAHIAHLSKTKQPIQYQHRVAHDYAILLGLLKKARYQTIEKYLPQIEKYHAQLFIKLFLIDYYAATKKTLPTTLTQFDPSLKSSEAIESKLFDYYLSQAQYLAATDLIQNALSRAPKNPGIWLAYADLEAKQQHEAEAYLYRAQAMFLLKKHHEAMRLLKIAEKKQTHYTYTHVKVKALQTLIKR